MIPPCADICMADAGAAALAGALKNNATVKELNINSGVWWGAYKPGPR